MARRNRIADPAFGFEAENEGSNSSGPLTRRISVIANSAGAPGAVG
jgi:hypothetical protein